jgi:hypothetical protein
VDPKKKMSECVQEEWITGMWYVFAGFVASLSGLVSLLIVAPLFAED